MQTRLLEKCLKFLNRYFHLDPEFQKRLKKCEGKILTLELNSPSLTFQLHFKKTKITGTTEPLSKPDAILKSSPLTLLRLAFAKDRQRFFTHKRVILLGDLEFADNVLKLFDQMDIDWEEYLSHFVGDIPAHELGRFMRHIKKSGRYARKSMVKTVDEYIHEEIKLSPGQLELADFFENVDTLRMDTDRLEARLKKLSVTE